MFRRNLEEDVKDDVSGYFKRFLVSLMAANRQEHHPPDYNRAAQQARVRHFTKKCVYQEGNFIMNCTKIF